MGRKVINLLRRWQNLGVKNTFNSVVFAFNTKAGNWALRSAC
jgi:hypothetical protein